MSKSIVIIGGGVIGFCAAYYAIKRGWTVTIVDRAAASHEGCSYGNAGLIVPSHVVPLAAPGMVALGLKWMWNPESPFYIKPRFDWDLLAWAWRFWRACTSEHVKRTGPLLRDLHMASRTCFEQLASEFKNPFQFEQKGLLNLCKTQHTLDEEARLAEHVRKLGLPAEVLDARATARLDPAIQMDIAGSVYFPKDCHLAPAQFMQIMRSYVEQCGVRILWETEVRGWRRSNARISGITTPVGEITGDEFVLCAGVWSQPLGRPLGLDLPMQAGKGYSLTLANPKRRPTISAILTEARVAVTPMPGQLRFGGTMEIAGLDERINPSRVRGIINSVPQYYPEFQLDDFREVRPWCGLRPCSPDGLPYIGRSNRYDNLSIATGHAMMGLSLGPVTGLLVSELIAGEMPSVDITLLNPQRYST